MDYGLISHLICIQYNIYTLFNASAYIYIYTHIYKDHACMQLCLFKNENKFACPWSWKEEEKKDNQSKGIKF